MNAPRNPQAGVAPAPTQAPAEETADEKRTGLARAGSGRKVSTAGRASCETGSPNRCYATPRAS